MNSIHKHIFNHAFQNHPPIKTQQSSSYQPPLATSDTGFPILAIAVLCIMATAFLLVSYYIFVSKCCLDWQQLDPLQRFSISRTRRNEDPLMAYSPSFQNRGLDELLINEIPTFQYMRGDDTEDKSLYKCVVCLNEFQEQDMLRVLPNCSHAFHLDCIDIWLQSNSNCPLCRSSISGTTQYPIDQIVAPTSSPQDPQPFTGSLMGSDEDFVVIELSGGDGTVMLPNRQQERDDSRVMAQSRGHSPRKVEQKPMKSKPRKFNHVSIMGDECIDVRERDDQFSVQPIRRSFSMDSAADRHIYLSIQEIIRQNRQISTERNNEECSSRVRRSIFPFRHGGSKSAVLPIESDL